MASPATIPTDYINFSLLSDAEYVEWQRQLEPADGVPAEATNAAAGIESVPF